MGVEGVELHKGGGPSLEGLKGRITGSWCLKFVFGETLNNAVKVRCKESV